MKRSPGPRLSANLSESTNRKLNMYAVAVCSLKTTFRSFELLRRPNRHDGFSRLCNGSSLNFTIG
jgi:hypothetical protein